LSQITEYEKGFRTLEFKTLDGEFRAVRFELLKRKAASRIYHTTISAIIDTISSVGFKAASSQNVQSVMSSLDHDTVIWPLAEILLRGGSFKTSPDDDLQAFGDLEKCDHFEDNWDELYLLLYKGIEANFPKSITRLKSKMGKLKDFGQWMQNMAGKLTK
jgi:hypothetical protein